MTTRWNLSSDVPFNVMMSLNVMVLTVFWLIYRPSQLIDKHVVAQNGKTQAQMPPNCALVQYLSKCTTDYRVIDTVLNQDRHCDGIILLHSLPNYPLVVSLISAVSSEWNCVGTYCRGRGLEDGRANS